MTGGRSSGDGPISQMKSASRSSATRAVAEPQTTGNTDGLVDADGEGVLELLERRDVALEVPLEQVVVGDDDALDQVVVDLVLERLHVVGHLAVGGGAAVVEPGGVGEQVGDAAEVRLLADRELERGDAGPEAVAQLVEGPLEVGPLPVELVDEHHAGDAELGRQPPDRLGLHLDALDRADHEHGEVGDPQRGVDVADEVGVAGRVDQVDLVALPLERAPPRATARCPGAAPRGRSR